MIQILAGDDDDDWGEDITEAGVLKRMKELTDAAKNMAMSDDLEKTANERMDLFYEFVKVILDRPLNLPSHPYSTPVVLGIQYILNLGTTG